MPAFPTSDNRAFSFLRGRRPLIFPPWRRAPPRQSIHHPAFCLFKKIDMARMQAVKRTEYEYFFHVAETPT